MFETYFNIKLLITAILFTAAVLFYCAKTAVPEDHPVTNSTLRHQGMMHTTIDPWDMLSVRLLSTVYWMTKACASILLHVTRLNENSIGELSEADLSGLTFYVPDTKATCMTIDGQEVTDFKRNAPDHTGRPSVSLDWPMLEFPKI